MTYSRVSLLLIAGVLFAPYAAFAQADMQATSDETPAPTPRLVWVEGPKGQLIDEHTQAPAPKKKVVKPKPKKKPTPPKRIVAPTVPMPPAPPPAAMAPPAPPPAAVVPPPPPAMDSVLGSSSMTAPTPPPPPPAHAEAPPPLPTVTPPPAPPPVAVVPPPPPPVQAPPPPPPAPAAAVPPPPSQPDAAIAATGAALATPPAPAEAAPAPAVAPAPASDSKGTPTLRIAFKTTETTVPLTVKDDLDKLAKQLVQNDSQRVTLIAYASSVGDQTSTARRISLSRALSIRAQLIDDGVNNLRINVQAEGDKNNGGVPDRVDVFVQ